MPGKIIQPSWTNSPDEARMSTATALDYDDAARTFVERIETLRGRGAAPRVIGAGPGTIENIRRGRRKGITASLFARIRGAAIRELEKEIRVLQAELDLALASGIGAESDEIQQAQAALGQAREAIKKIGQPSGGN